MYTITSDVNLAPPHNRVASQLNTFNDYSEESAGVCNYLKIGSIEDLEISGPFMRFKMENGDIATTGPLLWAKITLW